MNLSNVANFVPVTWAQAPTSDVFGATGLGAMFKWDGYSTSVALVGVSPPVNAPTIAFSGVGAITGSYTAFLRFVDKDGNFSNVSPISNTATAASNSTVTYSGLDLNSAVEPTKAVRRQLLRSTAGESATYYVDIDTTDLTSTSLTSTKDDTALTASTAVPLSQLSIYGTPPSHKAVIANHLGRMFAAVDVVDDRGCVQVTNGSVNVTIIGGHISQVTNRFLYVTGATKAYQLDPTQTLTSQTQFRLLTPYTDSSDKYAPYAIRVATTERNLIYFSNANAPEGWPATNAVSMQEDGDEITGLMSFGSFLYILKERHVYRFTFQSDPIADGAIFLALNRGCLNQRCWVAVEGTAYMLDDQGIHAYGGARDSEPISTTVQDLFRFSDSTLRVNWAAQKWFHCVHFSSQETIRWFVALSGSYLPYHAICYNYRQKRWWVEEFAVPVGASSLGRIGKYTKTPQVYLGSSGCRILAMWQGTLDGPDPSTGKVHGIVTAVGSFEGFTDATGTFPSAGVTDNPAVIVDGRGKGQRRIVRAGAGGSVIKVKHPWRIRPDTTSVYQLGGIQWQVQFGWWRTLLYEQLNERYLAVIFQPCASAALATMRMFTDFGTTPFTWTGDYTLTDGNGARTVKGSTDVVLDFTKPSGYIHKRFPGHREFFADGVRYLSFELSGVSNADQQRLYYVMAGGVDQG